MFERLQKERESEEQKLEAARVTLRQQQEQLEKELTEQRTKLEQLLTAVTAAEGRLRTLQEEERCSESLEMTLSQASEYTAGLGVAGWLGCASACLGKYVKKTQALARVQGGGRRTEAGRRAAALGEMAEDTGAEGVCLYGEV